MMKKWCIMLNNGRYNIKYDFSGQHNKSVLNIASLLINISPKNNLALHS